MKLTLHYTTKFPFIKFVRDEELGDIIADFNKKISRLSSVIDRKQEQIAQNAETAARLNRENQSLHVESLEAINVRENIKKIIGKDNA